MIGTQQHMRVNEQSTKPATTTRRGDERRIDRRMDMRFPVELRGLQPEANRVIRTVSSNISSHGLYVEVDTGEYRSGQRMQIDMRVPAAEGVSPAEGRASCTGEIVRIDATGDRAGHSGRQGLAIRFVDRLTLSF